MGIEGLSEEAFRRACGKFATGVAVATVRTADGVPHGLTINSFTSVSLAPPLVLICIDYRSAVLPHFREARAYGVNILAAEQQAWSNRFAQRMEQRFDEVAWQEGRTGVPLIEGVLAHLECEQRQTVEAGDHAVFIAEVVHATAFDGDPLLYFSGRYMSM